jgi:hypothetical protein
LQEPRRRPQQQFWVPPWGQQRLVGWQQQRQLAALAYGQVCGHWLPAAPCTCIVLVKVKADGGVAPPKDDLHSSNTHTTAKVSV